MSNIPTPVVAVVGSHADIRLEYASELAGSTERTLIPAHRLWAAEDPVAESAGLIASAAAPTGAVLEVPDRVSVADLVDTLAADTGTTRLEAVVCVLDAARGLDHLFREDCLTPRVGPAHTGHPDTATARSLVSITHVELASTLVVVNWEESSSDELRTLMALVHHLCPRARLRLLGGTPLQGLAGTDYDVGLPRPGWLNLLHGDYEAYVTHPRVSALPYQCIRPFHPGRLHDLAHELLSDGRFGTVVRSAGYCQLASSPRATGHWNHVGKVMSLVPVSVDDDLDLLLGPGTGTDRLAVGQDLAFIGLDLDHDALVRALDAAVLTDAEFLDGPAAWMQQSGRFL